jgi:hypothetical protein
MSIGTILLILLIIILLGGFSGIGGDGYGFRIWQRIIRLPSKLHLGCGGASWSC